MNNLEWGEPAEGASIAKRGCILRTVVGSQVHGLTNPGTDDRDEMGICIEPPGAAIGIGQPFEHWVYRTQPEGEPSGPGDLDLVVYSLRKFCRLALKGSPTVLLPLFAPKEHTLICTEIGEQLRDLAPAFVTERTRQGFLGYLASQRRDLVSNKKATRTRELSEEHGYDTKYAMHALRIAYQGLELWEHERITLPMPEPQRSQVMAVRRGQVPLDDVLTELDDLVTRLETSKAPTAAVIPPPELGIEGWVIETYLNEWRDWEAPALM